MRVTVGHAKAAARAWVNAAACHEPGFAGAFFHGSINGLADEAMLPPTSDVDVIVISANPPQVKPGKFIYQGVLLEVSCLSNDRLQSPEQVLANYQLAGSFRTPGIIADPSGHLTRLQAVVGQQFAKREWVRRRCEDVRTKLQHDLLPPDESQIFSDQVLAWLFGTGKSTHILLVAGLKNPTVRRRYVAVHDLLRDYGYAELHEHLLGLLGSGQMTRAQVEQHLVALAAVFDAASAVIQSPFVFAADLSAAARPIAIDGTRDLIEAGYHREAMFWIAVTYSRCQSVLDQDAPAAMQESFQAGYQRLLRDLGIHSSADLQARRAMTRDLLPRIWDVAQAIIAANPAVED